MKSITYAKLRIRGGLTGCIIGSPRNVSCAVSFFSRGFSRGFDKRHEFIPNASLDRSIRFFEFPIQIKGNKKTIIKIADYIVLFYILKLKTKVFHSYTLGRPNPSLSAALTFKTLFVAKVLNNTE